MRVKGSTCFVLFWLLTGLFIVLQAVAFRRWEAMALPLFFGSVIIVVSAVELVRELKGKGVAETEVGEGEESQPGPGGRIEFGRFCLSFGWVACFSGVTYLLGFLVSIPLFVIAYLRVQRRGWPMALGFGVAMTVAVYGIFDVGLKAALYRGAVWEWVSP